MVAIEHDRRRGLALPALLLLRVVVGVEVAHHQRQPRAVGRPGEILDAALDVGELHRLAAGAVQQPDLGALLLLVLVAARREEGQVLAVRAEARIRLVLGRRGHADLLAAVPARHPDVGVPLVLLDVDRAHRVGHPGPLRRALRIGDLAQPRQVLQHDRPFRRRSGQARSTTPATTTDRARAGIRRMKSLRRDHTTGAEKRARRTCRPPLGSTGLARARRRAPELARRRPTRGGAEPVAVKREQRSAWEDLAEYGVQPARRGWTRVGVHSANRHSRRKRATRTTSWFRRGPTPARGNRRSRLATEVTCRAGRDGSAPRGRSAAACEPGRRMGRPSGCRRWRCCRRAGRESGSDRRWPAAGPECPGS